MVHAGICALPNGMELGGGDCFYEWVNTGDYGLGHMALSELFLSELFAIFRHITQ